jgi:enamine deaminase RidA (YjgF/YER057c/UK114 family)
MGSEMESTAESRMAEGGIVLPAGTKPHPEKPFLPWRRDGDHVYLSGHLPDIEGQPVVRGQLGGEVALDEGVAAARRVALNLIATLRDVVGDLDNVEQIVKLLGFVNSAPGFTQQPQVINGASQCFIDVFGPDRGRHARSAVGVSALPQGVPVEVEAIVRIRTPHH